MDIEGKDLYYKVALKTNVTLLSAVCIQIKPKFNQFTLIYDLGGTGNKTWQKF